MRRNRKRTRKLGFDYATPGAYFVTACVKNRINNREIFGSVKNKIVLDEFIIMPDHVHGIIFIRKPIVPTEPLGGAGLKPTPPNGSDRSHGLSEIMRGFKTFSSRRINETNPPIRFQWQRSFHDQIIWEPLALLRIRKYIQNNPAKWNH